MKIAMVAGGHVAIPAPGWGAVEILIWNYKHYLERAGHTVDIYNSLWYHEVIEQLNHREYDFIHLQFDLYSGAFAKHLTKPFCVTSHFGGFATYVPGLTHPHYDILFRDMLEAPGNIVFLERAADIFRQNGYSGFLRLLRNPVETEQFRFAPRGNGRAICLGKIQPRKRQAWLAGLLRDRVPLDFAGPFDPADAPDFKPGGRARYLGNWNRDTVYQRLTDYNCLVLLSKSEGDALVVKEALAAGLSVVVNEASSANLTDEPFISVLPDEEQSAEPISRAIAEAIDRNDLLRPLVRAYAFRRFDYGVVIEEYLQIIDEFRSYYG
ncbi:MAG: hypothetical protein ACR2PL_09240 [Dehalococcoidia bacterium]